MAGAGRGGSIPPLDIEQILVEAQHRWLRPAEICEILQNHRKFHIAPEPPNRPPSGSLFLFDRKVLRYFRKDGHNWRKKKDGKTVKEAHERLKDKPSHSYAKDVEEVVQVTQMDNLFTSSSATSQGQLPSQTMDTDSPISAHTSEYEDAESDVADLGFSGSRTLFGLTSWDEILEQCAKGFQMIFNTWGSQVVTMEGNLRLQFLILGSYMQMISAPWITSPVHRKVLCRFHLLGHIILIMVKLKNVNGHVFWEVEVAAEFLADGTFQRQSPHKSGRVPLSDTCSNSRNVEKTILLWRQKLHPLHGFRAEAPSERQTMQRPIRMTMEENNLKLAADSHCKGQAMQESIMDVLLDAGDGDFMVEQEVFCETTYT
ncbi:IQ calmodulin-binding motif [Musa troglodytarum]|uniref:IQ calmodulin-binding motif n=1 Tax=Musa troglodytarum TaxID=320322 RepID=A0A9E7G4L2_9LILI|nr:IQ calmodulin-binding motif [Musa troglodytarum]